MTPRIAGGMRRLLPLAVVASAAAAAVVVLAASGAQTASVVAAESVAGSVADSVADAAHRLAAAAAGGGGVVGSGGGVGGGGATTTTTTTQDEDDDEYTTTTTTTTTTTLDDGGGMDAAFKAAQAEQIRAMFENAQGRLTNLASRVTAASADANDASAQINALLMDAWTSVDKIARDRCGSVVEKMTVTIRRAEKRAAAAEAAAEAATRVAAELRAAAGARTSWEKTFKAEIASERKRRAEAEAEVARVSDKLRWATAAGNASEVYDSVRERIDLLLTAVTERTAVLHRLEGVIGEVHREHVPWRDEIKALGEWVHERDEAMSSALAAAASSSSSSMRVRSGGGGGGGDGGGAAAAEASAAATKAALEKQAAELELKAEKRANAIERQLRDALAQRDAAAASTESLRSKIKSLSRNTFGAAGVGGGADGGGGDGGGGGGGVSGGGGSHSSSSSLGGSRHTAFRDDDEDLRGLLGTATACVVSLCLGALIAFFISAWQQSRFADDGGAGGGGAPVSNGGVPAVPTAAALLRGTSPLRGSVGGPRGGGGSTDAVSPAGSGGLSTPGSAFRRTPPQPMSYVGSGGRRT